MATIRLCLATKTPGRDKSAKTNKVARACAAALSLAIFVSCAPIPVLGAGSAIASPRPATPSQAELNRLGLKYVTTKPFFESSETVSEYQLKSNCLTVLLSERHATPIACVMIVYRVGSRNEAVGYTGSTHFLEHMMFKGTPKHDPAKGTGIDDILKPVGGYNNATTSYDRTNYFEIVPAKDINICFDIESDRMRHLLLRQEDHNSEMTVVRNELERNEDDPQMLLQQQLFSTAFQAHPYHHPVIGWRSDVERAPITRLRQFYNQYYWPNNATLLVVGDFNSSKVLQEIVSYFGKIPRSPRPFPDVYTQEPPQEGVRRFVVQRGGELPRVALGFHTAVTSTPDTYALDVMETVLGDESIKSSRLYRSLVDTGLASEADANNTSLRDPGLYVLSATVNGQNEPEKIEKVFLSEIDKLKTAPVGDAELARARSAIVKKLKLIDSDPVTLAEQMAEGIAVADWKWLLDYPRMVQRVTAADVERVAKKYFTEQNMSVGYYIPKTLPKQSEQLANATNTASTGATAPTSAVSAATSKEISSAPPSAVPTASQTATKQAGTTTDAIAPLPAAVPAAPSPNQPPVEPSHVSKPAGGTPLGTAGGVVLPPTVPTGSFTGRTHKFVLANGLTLLVMPVLGTGTVAVCGRIRAGEYFRTPQKSLVPDLMADLLTAGSANYSKESMSEKLQEMGCSLAFDIDDFWLAFNTEITKQDVGNFMPILADVLAHPLFLEDEIEKSKKQKAAALKDAMSDTTNVAWNHFVQAWYKPGSVYYNKPFEQQLSELNTINKQDFESFHSSHVTPANTVIAMVGDITPEQGRAAAQRVFQDWKGGKADYVAIKASDVLPNAQPKVSKVELPDKSNYDVYVGHPVKVSVRDPDYFATTLGNAALGYDSFACRLAPVRDKYGLTYFISSTLSAEFPYSPWVIGFSVNPENYNRALSLVDKIVREYGASGITARELAMEKSHLSGAYFVSMRGPKQIAAKLAELEILGLGPKFIDNFSTNLNKVTVPQVNSAIGKYFNLDQSSVSASGTAHPKKNTEAHED